MIKISSLILLTFALNSFAEDKATKVDAKKPNLLNIAKPTGEAGGWFPPSLEKDLALTDEQKKKLKALKEEVSEAWKKDQKEVSDAKIKMDEKMGTDASDKEIKNLFQELQKKRSSLEEKKFNQMMKVRGVLNAEQKKKVSDFQSKPMRGMPGGMGGKGMPLNLPGMFPAGSGLNKPKK